MFPEASYTLEGLIRQEPGDFWLGGRAQSFLPGEHLQRVVRAYQKFKDEPGFTRVVPIEEIRAREGNLSIPLYVGTESALAMEEAAEYRANGLPSALSAWLESSAAVRQSLESIIES